jgi:two-component system, NtrC family, response regulator AtoC
VEPTQKDPENGSTLTSVLVVDDDAAMREMLVALLEDEGMRARGAGSVPEALEAARDEDFDAVLSDIRMPHQGGIELIGELRQIRPLTPVVLMTAFGSIDSAVEALRSGAFDYITKPFKNEAVLAALDRALQRRALEGENRRLRRALERASSFGDLIGASPAMHEIFALIRKIAHSRGSVLITGESGTGKELIARTVHLTSVRKQGAFIPLNCTAMPEGLLESELFGHVRGAFTGAHTTKKGLFEEANGGTLFLDEIGDMAPGLQSKLLRVLQDQEIRPVGGNRGIRVDVRIIAATNKDLKEEIHEGRFRMDLFYRLNVIPIHIPPLRERPEDVPLLADHFIRKHAGNRQVHLSSESLELLTRLYWEGNARELENSIERALALCEGAEIGPEDLPSEQAPAEPAFEDNLLRVAANESWTLKQLLDRYTADVLERTKHNKVQAARILGINRRTLYRRSEARMAEGDEDHPDE